MPETYEKKIGVVGVDSGQVLIVDPCYIDSQWEKGQDKFAPTGPDEKPVLSYGDVCSVTLDGPGQIHYRMGHEGAGVASPTAYGDGVYPVFAQYNESGQLVGLRIDFEAIG